ncbi:hypothetical protein NEUTE2DRAFT_153550 [Neurospora tetrasperma FGSC 2509]|nr:hypothetical protein NEUTE2DRAFT_153550 [Neurospora tetrasperma FGSC 2509]
MQALLPKSMAAARSRFLFCCRSGRGLATLFNLKSLSFSLLAGLEAERYLEPAAQGWGVVVVFGMNERGSENKSN